MPRQARTSETVILYARFNLGSRSKLHTEPGNTATTHFKRLYQRADIAVLGQSNSGNISGNITGNIGRAVRTAVILLVAVSAYGSSAVAEQSNSNQAGNDQAAEQIASTGNPADSDSTTKKYIAPAFTSNAAGDLFFSTNHKLSDSVSVFNQPVILDHRARNGLTEPQSSSEAPRSTVLANHGDLLGSSDDSNTQQPLGTLVSAAGDLLDLGENATVRATAHAFVPAGEGGNLYSVWNSEGSYRGLSAISRLTLMPDNNALWSADLTTSSMLATTQIDGVFNVIGTSTTHWESVLFTEKMSPSLTSIWNHPQASVTDKTAATADELPELAAVATANALIDRGSNPYRYGYVVELRTPEAIGSVNDDGIYTAGMLRHYTTGRMDSAGPAIVTGAKSLYRISADAGLLFRFESDYDNNLASGHLWVAQLLPAATEPPTNKAQAQGEDSDHDKARALSQAYNIHWLHLAHGSNEGIDGWISSYEGMSSNEYTEGETSFLSDADIVQWAETRLTSGKPVDNRAAFLEPVKAAQALKEALSKSALNMSKGQQIPALEMTSLTRDKTSLFITADSDQPGCSMVYRAVLDTSGFVSRLEAVASELCDQTFALTASESFLPLSGQIYTTDNSSLASIQLE